MNLEDWRKAGKIASQVREYGKTLVKVDSSLLHVTEKIENKILELGAKPAFPINLSVNEIAAHYSALENDTTIFKKNDIVKLDVGVSVNGAIGDTACTIDLGGNEKLIKASEEALERAIKVVKPGVKLKEIGAVIQTTIQSHGFSPIKNLCGHGLNEFIIHDKPTIPNVDNNDNTQLEEGQIIAIEPFATTGVGLVMDSKPSGIYALINVRPVRNANSREILEFIGNEYSTLPFCKRWILKKYNKLTAFLALNTLEREEVIKQFSWLVEQSRQKVSQAEHTILVKEKPEILTL